MIPMLYGEWATVIATKLTVLGGPLARAGRLSCAQGCYSALAHLRFSAALRAGPRALRAHETDRDVHDVGAREARREQRICAFQRVVRLVVPQRRSRIASTV